MKPVQAVCNYAILRFRPYAETEEFVNVGVLAMCTQPCLLHFAAETTMPARAKTLFPEQNEQTFASALNALTRDMNRLKAQAHEPKTVQITFNETVRIRKSVFRFGGIRTILTDEPENLAEELFRRYVRMETVEARKKQLTP